MENASKAIIIAGAILIAIILVSIGVLVWKRYAGFASQNADDLRSQQIAEFNVKFQKYSVGEATAQDVRTIVNLANDYNQKYAADGEKIIIVKYKGNTAITTWSDAKWIDFFENALNSAGEEKKYKIEVSNNGQDYQSDTINYIEISEIV